MSDQLNVFPERIINGKDTEVIKYVLIVTVLYLSVCGVFLKMFYLLPLVLVCYISAHIMKCIEMWVYAK